MRTIDFSEVKAVKNGETTVKSLVENLMQAVEKGEIKNVAYVAQTDDDFLEIGCNDMPQTQAIGLLECGKGMIMGEMNE